MSREIKELHDAILRITQSVVVHTPRYSKFGGYEGENDIYTMDIARVLYHEEKYRKQSKGKWEIVIGSNGKEKMVCTNCRHGQDLASTFTYCPNCGARMKGEENEQREAD